MNLTAVTDEAEVMTRHVADSLAVLPPLERAYRARSTSGSGDIDGVSLIDVGSGAGLPGLILAVARPSKLLSSPVKLAEARRKVTAFGCFGCCNVDLFCSFQAGDLHCWSRCGSGARSWSTPLRSWGCLMWMWFVTELR
jgi:16S rRNA (guanine527-N7)-methyltransferase